MEMRKETGGEKQEGEVEEEREEEEKNRQRNPTTKIT